MAGIQQSKFGYKSLTLKKDTIEHLRDGYKRFQEDSGKPLLNYPTLSQFLDTVLTAFMSEDPPKLLLVSKSDTRTVIYDVAIHMPVVIDVDKKGNLACTRIQGVKEYQAFARSANPGMFKKVRVRSRS